MSDPIQGKTDVITAFVATSGTAAPVWMSWIDGTAKLAALAYSVLGAIWIIKKLLENSKEE